MQTINFSIFSRLKRNIEFLQGLRPDFRLEPSELGMMLQGSLVEQLLEENQKNETCIYTGVTACNCSIILNSFAYLEGCVEAALLKKIGDPNRLSEPIKGVLSEYRSRVIRCSRFDELKAHFHTLYGIKLIGIEALSPNDLTFVDRFYVVRHMLAHGSEIPTTAIHHQEGGTVISHNVEGYKELMKFIAERYGIQRAFDCDFFVLLLASTVIDDVCCCIYRLADAIEAHSIKHT